MVAITPSFSVQYVTVRKLSTDAGVVLGDRRFHWVSCSLSKPGFVASNRDGCVALNANA